jgi:hypothetical protein
MLKAWLAFLFRYLILAVIGAGLVVGGVYLWASGTYRSIPGAETAVARLQAALKPGETAAASAPDAPVAVSPVAGASAKPPVPHAPYVRRTSAHPIPPSRAADASAPGPAAPQDRPARNPHEKAYRAAETAYQDFWKREKQLEAELEKAEGAPRMELADELRAMQRSAIEVRTAYEAARENYNAWEREHAPTFTPDE